MKKRFFSLVMVVMIVFSIMPQLNITVFASGADNIAARADYLYNITWTAQATVKGYKNNYTYQKGATYRIPYGQPVSPENFIYWNISVDEFLSATQDATSKFYTTRSYNGSNSCTYYAMDCSAFASYCWGLPRRYTTSSWSSLPVTSYGKCTSANVNKIQVGDALNLAGSHIVIVSDVTYGSDGSITQVEITEQTPPQIKRSYYTPSKLVSKYSSYTIYRYNKRDSVSAPPQVANNPEGTVDACRGGAGTVYINGWTFDRDDISQSLELHVYIGGLNAHDPNAEGHNSIMANKLRTDVNTAHGCGDYHGFDQYIKTNKTGTQPVYIYAINIGSGENKLIDVKTVTITAPDTESPTISDVRVTNVDESGYTIKCTVSDNVGISEVLFPTWTVENDQDDIVWHAGEISGNEVTCRINKSDHGNENGIYTSQVYAYDFRENLSTARVGLTIVNQSEYTPTKEKRVGSKKYMLFENEYELGFTDCENYCELLGGHLATVTTAEENELITQLVQNGTKEKYFLGATDEKSEGAWKWLSGETWSYTNWGQNEPSNSNKKEHYLVMYNAVGAYKWNDDVSQADTIGFVCEIDLPTISDVEITNVTETGYTVNCKISEYADISEVLFPSWTVKNSQDDLVWHSGEVSGNKVTCRINKSDHSNENGVYVTHIYAFDSANNRESKRAGLVLINSSGYTPIAEKTVGLKKYMLFENADMLDFEDCKNYCELIGGHLATITSAEENKIITSMIQTDLKTGYFLGADDSKIEGEWKWITGEDWAYADWAEGEPNNSSNVEHYLAIYGEESDFKWNDTTKDSGNRIGFVCEIDLPPVKVTGVKLNKESLSLLTGETEALTAIIAPTDATNKDVNWVSSNINVATVSSDGVVTAIGAGTATIIVETKDGSKTYKCEVTVADPTIDVTGVSLNKSLTTINVGSTETLTATVVPSNATNDFVVWTSSNTSVATVSNGVVTAKSAGTATITVTTADGSKTANCIVTVKNPVIAVTGVTLNKTSTSLDVGSTTTLTATVSPSNATNKNVTWSSSNTNVATVSNGVVTAKSAGTATITVTTADGSKTASCIVTVKNPVIAVTGVTLNKISASLDVGSSTILTATVSPSNATNKNVTWSSSNTSVATVSNGVVTAKSAGTATITVTTADGSKTANCIVTVKNPVIAVTGVTLNKTSASLDVGSSTTLTATVSPSNATNKNITWSSSNTSVATVSNGVVTAKAAGTATITVTTADGSKTAKCTVTVNEKEEVSTPDGGKIKVSSVSASAGGMVDVTIDISENKGFANLGLEVGYDSSTLTLVSAVNNSAVGATYTPAQSLNKNPYTMTWDSTSNVSFNGILVTLTFKVNENAKSGSYDITLDYYKGVNGNYKDGVDVNYDADFNAVSFAYTGGMIAVADYIPGDINGDGTVTSRDGTYMLRYLSGWGIDVNEAALDIDGNGTVNSKDGTILLRYLAGWDVELH